MILLLGLMVFLWVETAQCLEEDEGFTFEGEIRHLAVATNTVYISTDEKLYQLSHDLRLVRSLIQRGTLKDGEEQGEKEFHRVSDTNALNANLSINLLLPFVKNDTLVTCGAPNNSCGYCEVLDLKNISNLVYSENIQMGPLKRSNASISFLVDVKKNSGLTETYILTAIEKREDESKEIKCTSNIETINLHNVNDRQDGGIFSLLGGSENAVIRSEGIVEFVDGFQINSTVYLLSNVRSSDQNNKVHLSWFVSQTSKGDTLRSLRGVYLNVSDGGEGSRLLASSVISDGQPVLWSGVFSVDGGQANTELVVFDISPDLSIANNTNPHFIYNTTDHKVSQLKTLRPKTVLFQQTFMTSVATVRQKAWMVFFIGTGDGQLIKLVVDKIYNHACPEVLYRASDDRKVFPKIHLDPVDHKHVYLPFRNQMKRVSVSKCSTYTTFQKCWSAMDPYCVWCDSKRSCMFEDECPDSNWLSIPEEIQQKIVSHKLIKDPTGQINLIIQIHVTVATTGPSYFACQFSTTSKEPCRKNNPPPAFPRCTCILSNDTLPADGLDLTVKIRLRTIRLSEQLELINCSDIKGQASSLLCQRCISAGCGWRHNHCSWADHKMQNDTICQNMLSVSLPEISSITPSVVSFYGRDHALLSGRNLHNVSSVRIQQDLSCAPKQSPVWNNTGTSLMFNIPSTKMKGVVKVCVLLPDGSCHSRKMTLMGSHLDSVEGVTYSHAPQQVRPPINSSSQTLTYESPAAGTEVSDISVFLRVANQTLVCSTNLTYFPDPEFTTFTSVRIGEVVHITTQKRADKLEVTAAELSVWGVQDEKQYPCIIKDTESTYTPNFFICEIQNTTVDQFQHLMHQPSLSLSEDESSEEEETPSTSETTGMEGPNGPGRVALAEEVDREAFPVNEVLEPPATTAGAQQAMNSRLSHIATLTPQASSLSLDPTPAYGTLLLHTNMMQSLSKRLEGMLDKKEHILAAILLPVFKMDWVEDEIKRLQYRAMLKQELQSVDVPNDSDQAQTSNDLQRKSSASSFSKFNRIPSSINKSEVDIYLDSQTSDDFTEYMLLPKLKQLFIKYNTALPSSAPDGERADEPGSQLPLPGGEPDLLANLVGRRLSETPVGRQGVAVRGSEKGCSSLGPGAAKATDEGLDRGAGDLSLKCREEWGSCWDQDEWFCDTIQRSAVSISWFMRSIGLGVKPRGQANGGHKLNAELPPEDRGELRTLVGDHIYGKTMETEDVEQDQRRSLLGRGEFGKR
ncbi:uncharacterized protein LOC133424167 [Cololabis saira]|uniref:uncharacterized protein LOC133424167 n=1 Tax=Cololabis saira TaxID=129043 RepID=UPI002AD3AC3C|nr:uncharacterized protein LOC133424167 [Cololabis saira]